MKKVLIRSFLTTCLIGIFVMCGSILGINLTTNNNEPTLTVSQEQQAIPAATSLITSSSIFSEITNDGLVSYLKISIPVSSSTDVKSIIIKQTVGSASYTLNEDELGTKCYYTNSIGHVKTLNFYFTRPATYNVYYSTVAAEKTETCTFTPSLNTSVIESLAVTSSHTPQTVTSISKYQNEYFFLSSGTLGLPTDDFGLYNITSMINETEDTSFLTTIPHNSYGTINYIIESKNKCAKLVLPIKCLTTEFDVTFTKLNGDNINQMDYYFLSTGYVYNCGINGSITLSSLAVNLEGIVLSEQEKIEAFSYISFSVKNEMRNATNMASLNPTITSLTKESTAIKQDFTLNKSDHTIHTINAYLTGSEAATINPSVVKVKIITKLPINEQGEYVFNAILGQVEKNNTNDYIKGILNGYMEEGTKIYYAAQSVRIYNTGYANAASKLKYIYNDTEYTINKDSHKDFTTNSADSQAQIITNGATIYFKNDSSLFDSFFIFSAQIETYTTGYKFRENLLNGQMFKNDTTPIQVSPDANQTITEAISSYKYVIPANYSNFIPIHLQVTYNGTIFKDIKSFQAGDELTFTDFGKYTLEFYNLPSYEFLKTNLSSLGESLYYYTINFTISGPSIYTSNNGKTISNNMFTQGKTEVEVNINAGQKFIVYKNNTKFYEDTKSLGFNLSEPANWKIVIYNDQNTELKSLTFTIMDTVYQGFSLNSKEEYESLVINKLISSMPVELKELPQASSYHLLEEGKYRMIINTKENLHFYLNGVNSSAYTITESIINFEIAKSRFAIDFSSGTPGGRTSQKIIVTNVSGIELKSFEVLKNNKSVAKFNANQLTDWESVLEASKSFSENGIYTFRITDKFGNVYETQIEKYYKVNFALIMLILIIIAAIIVLITTILKVRHKVKVK